MAHIKRLLAIGVSISLAMIMLAGCDKKAQNQSLSYVPNAKIVGKTETGCEIYATKDITGKTDYDDHAISISPIDNLDTKLSVSIPQVVTKNQNQLPTINEILYNNGLLNDLSNDPDVQEFESRYGITFAEYNVVSICQQGTCTTAMHNIEFAKGCTFDRDTDTILSLDKYFDIEKLPDLYNSGELKIYMNQGYDDGTIKLLLQDYVDSYNTSTNFFISQNSVFLIVPVSGANSTYIIIETARN